MNLNGKRILLIMPTFFGYERQICEKLQSLGAFVTFLSDRPSLSTRTKILNRLHPILVKRSADAYFREAILRWSGKSFDFILIVKGESMSRAVTKELFAAFPKAKKIFYLWDSFKNSKGSRAKLDLFDSVLTFDPEDARATPNVRFRPLFYSDAYLHASPSASSDIGVLFVGTAHTDRYRVLRKLREALPSHTSTYYFLYLPSKLVYWGRRLLDPRLAGASAEMFQFRPLMTEENATLFQRAFAIADVERNVQKGLTIRTLEVLAAGKKLITTNPEIRKYDFYDQNNVLIIDRCHPVVPDAFFDTPFKPVPNALLSSYSLGAWLDEVFGSVAS